MFETVLRETTDAFRIRWKNYKSNARKLLKGENCVQQLLLEHFQNPGEDIQVL